jgi:hypothetical protein
MGTRIDERMSARIGVHKWEVHYTRTRKYTSAITHLLTQSPTHARTCTYSLTMYTVEAGLVVIALFDLLPTGADHVHHLLDLVQKISTHHRHLINDEHRTVAQTLLGLWGVHLLPVSDLARNYIGVARRDTRTPNGKYTHVERVQESSRESSREFKRVREFESSRESSRERERERPESRGPTCKYITQTRIHIHTHTHTHNFTHTRTQLHTHTHIHTHTHTQHLPPQPTNE